MQLRLGVPTSALEVITTIHEAVHAPKDVRSLKLITNTSWLYARISRSGNISKGVSSSTSFNNNYQSADQQKQ